MGVPQKGESARGTIVAGNTGSPADMTTAVINSMSLSRCRMHDRLRSTAMKQGCEGKNCMWSVLWQKNFTTDFSIA